MKEGVLMAQKPNSTDELIVIPTDLIDSILEFYHGIDHRGILGMTKSISRKFFIPNMTIESTLGHMDISGWRWRAS